MEMVVRSLVSKIPSGFLRGVKMRLTNLSETITCNMRHVIWWAFGVPNAINFGIAIAACYA